MQQAPVWGFVVFLLLSLAGAAFAKELEWAPHEGSFSVRAETNTVIEGKAFFVNKEKVPDLKQLQVLPTIPNTLGIKAQSDKKRSYALTFQGLGPAYGLGDHGSYGTTADLSLTNKHFELTGNGGKHRWISSFLIFPTAKAAAVVFSKDALRAKISRNEVVLGAGPTKRAAFYFFHGSMPEIYAAYRKVRIREGFPGVPPKSQLFEVGWESWDALRWQTNAETVQTEVKKALSFGIPVRWVVTGSGFWEPGGTTTSFGHWHPEKYGERKDLRRFFAENDIAWMIGQRTNFVAPGGPHQPKGRRNENASMTAIATSPGTDEALKRGFFWNKNPRQSHIFPLVPSYLLDGGKPAASKWFAEQFQRWEVDGVKEDTMIKVPSGAIFNRAFRAMAADGKLVMARNGAFSSPGTLLRINDTYGVKNQALRTPLNYLQYAASGAPNVYSDTVGFGSMGKEPLLNLRNAWLQALTAGMAVGQLPEGWPEEAQGTFREVFRFHWRLVPHLFDAAVKSSHSGYPHTLTPMPVAFPAEKEAHELVTADRRCFQWMVGEGLLACPPLEESDKREVWLPPGKWMRFGSSEVLPGGRFVQVAFSTNEVPAFVGEKGALVLRNDVTCTPEVHLFPHTRAGQTLQHHHLATGLVSRIVVEAPPSRSLVIPLGQPATIRVQGDKIERIPLVSD